MSDEQKPTPVPEETDPEEWWNQPDPEPEDPPTERELLKKIEAMRQAGRALPRWGYFKMFVVVLDILFFVGIGGFLISQSRLPYMGVLLVLIVLQLLILTDFFLTLFRLTRQARGEN